jgi:hypothetical protein
MSYGTKVAVAIDGEPRPPASFAPPARGIIGAGGRVELKLAQPSIGAHGILMIRTICHGTGYRLLVQNVCSAKLADLSGRIEAAHSLLWLSLDSSCPKIRDE